MRSRRPAPIRRCARPSPRLTPFAKTGGLGDVVGGAGRARSHRAGHDVAVFLPLYATSDKAGGRRSRRSRSCRTCRSRWGRGELPFSRLARRALPGSDLPVYFVHCPRALRPRRHLHAGLGRALRFAFLTRAALESLPADGLVARRRPLPTTGTRRWRRSTCKTLYAWDRLFARTKTVLTIHNLGYQGIVRRRGCSPTSACERRRTLLSRRTCSAGRVQLPQDRHRSTPTLVTTVSETYAREIQTPEHGFGLDALLRARRETCRHRQRHRRRGVGTRARPAPRRADYSADDLGRAKASACKRGAAREAGLARRPTAPLRRRSSRASPAQKGFDLSFDTLPRAARRRRRCASWRWAAARRRYVELPRLAARRFPRRAPPSTRATATSWRTASRPAPTSSSCRRATSPAA